jgi:large subunit ribosomal protein L6
MPVVVPSKVKVELKDGTVKTTGPKGTLSMPVHPDIKVAVVETEVLVTRPSDHRRHRALHGMTRAIIQNMVTGVSQGFEKALEIQGVGFRAAMQGGKLVMNLGFSHQVEYTKPADVEIEVKDQRLITVRGIDRQRVGQVAADIRGCKPPEPYKGTGIRYTNEKVFRKEGKAGA